MCKALPRVIHIKCEGEPGISFLAATVRHTISEAGATQPGKSCLLSRLSELLFIEVLRRHIAGLPAGAVGWLAALNDPMVGRALQLMQLAASMLRQGDQRIAAVAAHAGYESEPAFNRAFKRYAGAPPAAWRAKMLAITAPAAPR